MFIPVLDILTDVLNEVLTDTKLPRRPDLRVRMPNRASIMLSHEAPFGVKWKLTLGSRQATDRTSGVE